MFLQDTQEIIKLMQEIEADSSTNMEEVQTINAIIKDPKLAVNKINEYKGEGIRKFEFRPQEWNQFVGQEEAKERAKTIIKKVKKGLKAHFLVDGIKGHGKTTFVELLAKDIDAHLI